MIALIMRLDESAVVWFSLRRHRTMDFIMKAATRIGDGYVWGAMGIAVWLLGEDGAAVLRHLGLAFGLELSAYKIIKHRFGRPRPFVSTPAVSMAIHPPDEFSFPSGHTAAAFVVATVLGAAFSVVLVPLFILAIVIGISRVYLGVHYPTDVVAGAALGVVSGAVAILLS